MWGSITFCIYLSAIRENLPVRQQERMARALTGKPRRPEGSSVDGRPDSCRMGRPALKWPPYDWKRAGEGLTLGHDVSGDRGDDSDDDGGIGDGGGRGDDSDGDGNDRRDDNGGGHGDVDGGDGDGDDNGGNRGDDNGGIDGGGSRSDGNGVDGGGGKGDGNDGGGGDRGDDNSVDAGGEERRNCSSTQAGFPGDGRTCSG